MTGFNVRTLITVVALLGALVVLSGCTEEEVTVTGQSDLPKALTMDAYLTIYGDGRVRLQGEVEHAKGQITSTVSWGSVECPAQTCPQKIAGAVLDVTAVYYIGHNEENVGKTTWITVVAKDKGREANDTVAYTSPAFEPFSSTGTAVRILPLIQDRSR